MKKLRFAAAIFGALVLFYVVFAIGTSSPMGHDEDQFVSPGIVTWKTGALPWKDYPLFHTPYLVMLNGAAAMVGDHQFLVLRCLGAVAAWLNMLLVGWLVWRLTDRLSPWTRLALVSVLLTVPLFSVLYHESIFLVWNHQAPTLLATMAVAACVLAKGSSRTGLWLLGAGICIGLATGMRLTFLLFFAPLGLAALFLSADSWRVRMLRGGWFGLGAALALLPMAWMASQNVEAFGFCNFRYPKLSLMWRKYSFWKEESVKHVDAERGYFNAKPGDFRGRSLGRKIRLLYGEVWEDNKALVTLLLLGVLAAAVAAYKNPVLRWPVALLGAAFVFSAWGALAPSRVNLQYWYTPLIFALAMTGIGLAYLRTAGGILLGMALLFSLPQWELLRCATVVGGRLWSPNILRGQLAELDKALPQGRILTLLPWRVQMLGREIYPEFALGEFAWRSAHLLPRKDRERFRLVSPFDLDALLAANPPDGILLDTEEKELNGPIEEWAKAKGFGKQPVSDSGDLWLPPR